MEKRGRFGIILIWLFILVVVAMGILTAYLNGSFG